ncbi:MAG TPA: ribonuclease D [Anaeromyxobacter sp.]|nr:ribonuclease D [Anaeromyxobacter sp.]
MERVPPPTLVADPLALARFREALRAEPVVALDTESNSFHVYRERVCLVQVSTPGGDWVLDPLAVDLSSLSEELCDGRETVLHGADYDVRCLRREWGWRLPRLFDTMLAARRLGHSALGLSAMVEARFGVKLSKAFQRSDWGHRPLTEAQLAYAALDTHFLLPLREKLLEELNGRQALEEARREFARVAAAEPRERVFDPEGYRRIRGSRELGAGQLRVLRALYLAREDRARAADRPPFKVLGDQTLLDLARARPRTEAAMRAVPGVTPSVLRRMGDAILAAVAAGGADPSI